VIKPPTPRALILAAVSGFQYSDMTGVLIGEEHLVYGANDRALHMLHLNEIPAEGVSWVALTPPEYQGSDDRAIVDAIKYGVSGWFRKEFLVGAGDRIAIDLVAIATASDPFRWIAFMRLAGSSPLQVQHASSFSSSERSSSHDDATFRLARRLAGAVTLRDVVVAVDRLAAGSLGCEYVNFALASENQTLRIHHVPSANPLIAERWDEIPLDRSTLLGECLLNDIAAVLTIDEFEERYPALGSDGRAMGFSHLGAAAMHTEDGRVVGVVGLGWRDEQLNADLDRIRGVGDLIGNATDLALNTDLARSMASAFQEMLLPTKLDPVVGGDVHVRYQAVDRAVGGDFYDVVTGADSSSWLVIGDVVGHGLAASRTMAKVRFFLRSCVRSHIDPSEVLALVHELLEAEGLQELVTCLIARWDPKVSELTFATAGHLPPIVCSDISTVLEIPVNPLLGLPGARFDAGNLVVAISRPVRLLLYTDGLIERRHEAIDTSIQALATQLEHHDRGGSRPLEELADALIDGATSTVDDDMALLVVSLLPFGGSLMPD